MVKYTTNDLIGHELQEIVNEEETICFKFAGFNVTFSADADCCGRAWISDNFKGIEWEHKTSNDISVTECKELLVRNTLTFVGLCEKRDSNFNEDSIIKHDIGRGTEVHTVVINVTVTNKISGDTCEKSIVFYMYGEHNGYYPPCLHVRINSSSA